MTAHPRIRGGHMPGERGQQPIEGDLELLGVRRHAEDPRPHHVGSEEDGPHGERVGDPAHGGRNRHVASDVDGNGGGDQHLEGHRDHRAEDPDRDGARGGPAVELPEVPLVQETAEESHSRLRPDLSRLGKPAIEKATRHSGVRLIPSTVCGLSGRNRRPTIRGASTSGVRTRRRRQPAGGHGGRRRPARGPGACGPAPGTAKRVG